MRNPTPLQGDPLSATGEGEDEREVRPLYAVVATVSGIVLLAILILAIEPLRSGVGDAVSGDTGDLRGDLRGLGVGGVMITLTLALAHVVDLVPGRDPRPRGRLRLRVLGRPALVMAGWLANGVLAYWIGRHAARPLLYRFVGQQRFDRLEQAVEAGGVDPAARHARSSR